MSEKNTPRQTQASSRSGSQATPRRRRGARPQGRSRWPSPPLLAAGVVILLGAALLLTSGRGGSSPGDLPADSGEQRTVLTSPAAATGGPRSGSVDIEDEHQPLVPEQPQGGAASASTGSVGAMDATARANRQAGPSSPAADRTADRTDDAAPSERPTARPAPARTAAGAPVKPRATGPWLVQVGAYSREANADGVVADLAGKGIDAWVHVAGTPSGDILYQVWVGWFGSRAEAEAYKAGHAALGDAFVKKRPS